MRVLHYDVMGLKMQTVKERISNEVTLDPQGTQDYEMHSPTLNAMKGKIRHLADYSMLLFVN